MKKFIAILMAVLSICTALLFACSSEEGGVQHTHEYTWFMVRQASCTTEGSLEGLCSCGEKTYESIPKSHMMNNDGVCILCGEVDNANHAHEWVWTKTLNPKCDENGLSVATCHCGATNMKTEPALGHSYGWDGICSVCGQGAANLNERWEYDYVDVEEIIGYGLRSSRIQPIIVEKISMNSTGVLKMDINYVDRNLTNDARVIEDVCWMGDRVDYETTVPANVKTISQFVLIDYDSNTKMSIRDYQNVASIVYTDGTKVGIGVVAGVHISGWTYDGFGSRDAYENFLDSYDTLDRKYVLENVIINQDNLLLGVYADDTIKVLGKIATSNEELVHSKYAFVKLKDGNMGFAGIFDKTLKEVTIPSTHAGKPVTAIFNEVFNKNRTITKVTVPNSVKLVANYAFASCANLKGVVFQGDLDKLGRESFINCPSLEYVVLGKVRVMNNFVFENTNIFLTEYTEVPPNWVYWQDNCKVYCKGEWSYVNGVPTPNK